MSDLEEDKILKQKTARTLKWNTIDRISSQVLYGVVGIVLANVVSQEDFGLVGALLVFQTFAIIFSDSGLGTALLRDKSATKADFSSVFWFNLIVSVGIYWILWFGSPVIADIFQGDRRLIPLSKVMFLTFVLNALAIIQTTRLMREMNVRMIAISNLSGQIAGGGLGIGLALAGYGAWALVWQSVTQAGVRTSILWCTGNWKPDFSVTKESFRKIWKFGMSVFSSALLSNIFQTVYSFIIGAFYSLKTLGVYTQADKWSKMGSASLSQILTASFVPLLAKVQDDGEVFKRYVKKINRFGSFIACPVLMGLAVAGEPVFHTLFGNKWDESILLFQILCIRGLMIFFISLYGNYIIALGKGRHLLAIEIIKDVTVLIAILATIWFSNVDLLVWGQLWAAAAAYVLVLWLTAKEIGYSVINMLADILPFFFASLLLCAGCYLLSMIHLHPVLKLLIEVFAGLGIYLLIMWVGRFPELKEALGYLRKK